VYEPPASGGSFFICYNTDMRKNYLIASIIGIAVGYLSAQTFFVHSWLALIPWGIVGILVGLLAHETKQKLWAGAYYGFFLCGSFLLAQYHGTQSIWHGFIIMVIIIGMLGAICGAALAYTSKFFRKV
jgi:hypothetical protein